MKTYVRPLLFGFVLILISTIVTFAAATAYVQTIKVPPCADAVAYAISTNTNSVDGYNCLTNTIRQRYPNKETWATEFIHRRKFPENPGPIDSVWAQQDRQNHWAIIYIGVFDSPDGQLPYTITIFTREGLVDFILA